MPIVDDIYQTGLYRELSSKYGEIIGGAKLAHVLGYSTVAAFRKALERDTLNLPVFSVEGRSGRFALTSDVAHWLLMSRKWVRHEGPQIQNRP